MKILIFSWRGPGHPHAGGAEIVTHEYAKAWVKNGYDVTLFTSAYPKCKVNENIDGVNIIRKGSELLTVQINAFWWYISQGQKFDLVFDHFHGIPFFTPLYVSVPKIGFIHELAKSVWKMNALPTYISWIPSFVGPIIEPEIFKIFYRHIQFITVSASTAKDLKEVGIDENNINILENGVKKPKNLKIFKKLKIKTIAYLGPLAKDKGYDLALDVFGKLYKKDKSYQFWMIGKGGSEELKKAKDIGKKIGITSAVKYWGYVSESKKYELLSKAHLLINPSAHEGWGLVNIEANLVKTPVVAFDVSGNCDSIKHGVTGILAEYPDTQKLTYEIDKLLSSPKRYEQMRVESYKWGCKFTWESSINKSLSLIRTNLKSSTK